METALIGCFQGGGQEGFQISLYMGIHIVSAVGCGLGHCEHCFIPFQNSRKKFAVLEAFWVFLLCIGNTQCSEFMNRSLPAMMQLH